MLPENRKRKIVELVSERDGCSVSELSDALGYSEATIRRDLRELGDENLVERSHGGAVPVTNVGNEQNYDQREIQNLERKTAIGARAAEEIREGQVVFFDSGTTTMQVAKRAPTDGSILPVTNSPLLALELGDGDNEVKLTGGTLRQRTKALVGPTAVSALRNMNFDLLFLGTNAIDLESGLTTPNEDEARVKELMIENANVVVLVADGSKLDSESFARFGRLSDVDMFVTDVTLPDDYAAAFDEAGVTIVESVV